MNRISFEQLLVWHVFPGASLVRCSFDGDDSESLLSLQKLTVQSGRGEKEAERVTGSAHSYRGCFDLLPADFTSQGSVFVLLCLSSFHGVRVKQKRKPVTHSLLDSLTHPAVTEPH